MKQKNKSGSVWKKYFAMRDLHFGRTFTVPCSGLLTTPRQVDLAMLHQLVEKKK